MGEKSKPRGGAGRGGGRGRSLADPLYLVSGRSCTDTRCWVAGVIRGHLGVALAADRAKSGPSRRPGSSPLAALQSARPTARLNAALLPGLIAQAAPPAGGRVLIKRAQKSTKGHRVASCDLI